MACGVLLSGVCPPASIAECKYRTRFNQMLAHDIIAFLPSLESNRTQMAS